ncbi:hypothetical protein AB1Y20_004968 [Prymnesium parvum]|uniref:Pyrroline-5-carboxylate reductase catalytic N-terminal domain-containing protein n=1 Tax=Prymnesium parvum TaxID=97485 RepID=A0AB34J1Z1_PRYPA
MSSYQLLRPTHPSYEHLYLTLFPLKQLISAQCIFLASACQSLQQSCIARVQQQFAYTWEKRLASYYNDPPLESLSADAAVERRFTIGIVGGGSMGLHLARALIDAGFDPLQLLVGTRTPSRLKLLSERGVRVVADVPSVARLSHVLFVCVLPVHLTDVAKALRGSLSRHTLTISLVAGVRRTKLQQLLGTPAVLATRHDEALAALRDKRHAALISPAAGPLKRLTPELLRLSARLVAPDVRALDELLLTLPAVVQGLELADADVRAACAEVLMELKSFEDVGAALELIDSIERKPAEEGTNGVKAGEEEARADPPGEQRAESAGEQKAGEESIGEEKGNDAIKSEETAGVGTPCEERTDVGSSDVEGVDACSETSSSRPEKPDTVVLRFLYERFEEVLSPLVDDEGGAKDEGWTALPPSALTHGR